MDRRYAGSSEPFPQFVFMRLPNDRLGEPMPLRGYPYEASFVEDNDLAAGRILEYLSHSRWWPNMAVFVTESDTQGSLDHIDAHRTLLLAAGPYVKRNYVSHTNASFPGLLRTIFELLRVPPLNLIGCDRGQCAGDFYCRAGLHALYPACARSTNLSIRRNFPQDKKLRLFSTARPISADW